MLQKQAIPINFRQGMDQKTDPKQVTLGKFISLVNSVFNSVGALTKRNGFPQLSALSGTASYLTTFSDDLTAVGSTLQAYISASGTWTSRGSLQPLDVSVLPLIRNTVNQSQCDSVTASNGLICVVYTETTGAATSYKYAIADSVTGQNIVAPTALSASATYGTPRVFLLGNYFVMVYATGSGTYHLDFTAVSYIDTTITPTTGTISASYTPATTQAFDGVVYGPNLVLAWNGDGSSGLKMASLSSGLVVSATSVIDSSHVATLVGVTADSVNGYIWVAYYDSGGSTGYVVCVTPALVSILAATQIIATGTILNLAPAAISGTLTLFYEVSNNYSYDAAIPSHYVAARTCTQAGSLGTAYTVVRSVGLASKAFYIGTSSYFLAAYQSTYQPTYFMISGASLQAAPVVVAKLAYENGGGYLVTGLPNVTVTDTVAQVPYLFKDLVQAVNKGTALASGTQTAGIYSQTGINLASLDFTTDGLDSAEIGNNLNLSGGFLWMYDGYLPVEQNFFLFPDSIECTWSAAGGSIVAKPDGSTNASAYWYQVTYEWTDNQGNAFKSPPSVPVAVTTTGSGTAGSITVNIPYLRLTYKTANPVKITVYRWSVGQQSYYQTTSITVPKLNSTTSDSLAFVDTLADATILGNNLIYTTGGVLEDTNGPASNILTLFDTRLWLVDAEDPDLLWFSKTVVEAAPVEMSDLLTYFVAPNAGTTVSTGPITALAPMDDKLIVFKKDAMFYINGTGPDSTGNNSQYSQPIFISSTVGCSNQQSIVLTGQGLMFQSSKGIWLLKRDLSVEYIGADVSGYNDDPVKSALNIPQTNQVRFMLESGVTLMYDYYVGQWGLFKGIPGVSATIYQDLHTYINSSGHVFQESDGTYLDGATPVVMSFVTSWINLAGLQGYQRAYFLYILGTYLSPHKLGVSIAYDYNASPTQYSLISPTNFSPVYGGAEADGQYSVYGQQSPYGGAENIEWWRVFMDKQRCSAFQITVQEIFDASFGVVAGAGLTLSGLNLVVALKKGFRPISAAHSIGGSGSQGGPGP